MALIGPEADARIKSSIARRQSGKLHRIPTTKLERLWFRNDDG